VRHVARESNDFNPKGSRAVRVQTVNGEPRRPTDRGLSRSGMGTGFRRDHAELIAALAQRLGTPRNVFDVEPRERRGECALGLRNGRQYRHVENARAGVDLVIPLYAAGGAQDVGDADALSLARELIAAVRAADAEKDALVHQRLQHRFEMPRREVVTRGELSRGNGAYARVQRNIDNSGDGEQALAGKQ